MIRDIALFICGAGIGFSAYSARLKMLNGALRDSWYNAVLALVCACVLVAIL